MTVLAVSTNEKDPAKFAVAINQLGSGRSNASGTVTLTASTTTTVVTAPNCGTGSEVFLMQKTANAATAFATTYVSAVGNGSFTLTHASNSQVDRTFGFFAVG